MPAGSELNEGLGCRSLEKRKFVEVEIVIELRFRFGRKLLVTRVKKELRCAKRNGTPCLEFEVDNESNITWTGFVWLEIRNW